MTSKRDIELQRSFVEAFNTRDTEAMIALCDPSIEWHSEFGVVGAALRGHDVDVDVSGVFAAERDRGSVG